MSETRSYQGHTYKRNGPGDPWTLSGAVATSPSRAPVLFEDPYKAKEQERADTSTAMEVRRAELQAQNNNREVTNSRLKNPQDLRQEYEKLPEVQNYRLALEQAHRAMNTDANPQGDLALTYAFAKAMDPSSAVRDGEQQMATSTQPWLQAAAESVKKQFGMSGAGTFTPQARAALRQQVFRQVSSLKVVYDARRADMSDNAMANRIKPQEVVGRDDTALYAPAFRSYAEHNGDGQGVIGGIIGGDPIKAGGNAPLGPDLKAAGQGATQTAVPIPAAMQQEHADYLAQHWGHLDPRDYAAFRTNLDGKYGLTADPGAYAADAGKLNKYAANGGQSSQIPGIPGPMRNMTGGEQFLNDIVSSPWGTAAATTMNGISFGIPEMLAGQKFDALRQLNPKSALGGDMLGVGINVALTGGAMKALSSGATEGSAVARALANPLTADMASGGIYGGTTAIGHGKSVVPGILEGVGGGYLGNRVGGAIGKTFPHLFGARVGALDRAVPTSEDLQTVASGLYHNMEANGLTASGDQTDALADGAKAILAKAGKITPKDALADTSSDVNGAYKLISDFAGQPMTPANYQTVRTVIADGLGSQKKADRRVAKALLQHFDDWTAETNPQMAETWKDARDVSSRYLQGDALKQAADLAGVRSGQFSQAGMENALRVDYRQLARKAIKGQGNSFTPETTAAIDTVVNGTPVGNAARWLGKLAPTGQLGMFGYLGAASAGASKFGTAGAIPSLLLAGTGTAARRVARGVTERAAQVAENTAYGGPKYAVALHNLVSQAAVNGGDAATGALVGGADPRLHDLIVQALLTNPAPVQ